jgi:hypothetical protein
MIYLSVGAVLGVASLAFLAGMLTFKAKLRWCRACGATLTCPDCRIARRLSARRSSAPRRPSAEGHA